MTEWYVKADWLAEMTKDSVKGPQNGIYFFDSKNLLTFTTF